MTPLPLCLTWLYGPKPHHRASYHTICPHVSGPARRGLPEFVEPAGSCAPVRDAIATRHRFATCIVVDSIQAGSYNTSLCDESTDSLLGWLYDGFVMHTLSSPHVPTQRANSLQNVTKRLFMCLRTSHVFCRQIARLLWFLQALTGRHLWLSPDTFINYVLGNSRYLQETKWSRARTAPHAEFFEGR